MKQYLFREYSFILVISVISVKQNSKSYEPVTLHSHTRLALIVPTPLLRSNIVVNSRVFSSLIGHDNNQTAKSRHWSCLGMNIFCEWWFGAYLWNIFCRDKEYTTRSVFSKIMLFQGLIQYYTKILQVLIK